MERSTIFNGKTHYFDWAIFNSELLNYQRGRWLVEVVMLFSFEILRVLGCCTACTWRLYVPNITPLSNVLSSPNSCIPLDFIPNVSKNIFPNIISQIWCYPDPVLYPDSISSDLIYWFCKYLTCSILNSHPQPWMIGLVETLPLPSGYLTVCHGIDSP